MSELKAINAYRLTTNTEDSDVYIHNDEFGCGGDLVECYLKSEADKVIAELKGQVNGFKNRSNLWHYNAVEEHKKFVQADKVIAHNKYKRCLAMANICESNVIWVKGCSEWRRWKKWHKRWLELAEKFKDKEAK